jgi:outer membrane lipoprotein-sorting protein
MGKGLLFGLLLLLPAAAAGQATVPATGEERQVMLEKITAAARGMTSLACRFTQVKELSMLEERMVSRGEMFYRQDNCLRWEYLSPYLYTFVLNETRVLVQGEQGRNVVDVQSSRLFREIVKIMMSSVNGRGLEDTRAFTATCYRDAGAWRVTLVPVQRETRRVFSVIELTFNVEDYSVDRVRMEEPNGDTTVIELSGKRFNTTLDDALFTID